jgi:putative ABC transport system ATP-binding protein
MKKLIELKRVWKIYTLGKNKVYALRDIDFVLYENDFVAIMGPSGSGKSTLLHLLGLLDKPTKGNIFFDGKEIMALSKDEMAEIRNSKIGFIFQQFNLVPHLSALENVLLPVLFSDKEKSEKVEYAKKLLAMVGLGGRENHKATELSGGEQQRVAIARALINNPSIILADEPTGNLDSKSGKQIMEILVDLWKNKKTIVVVTHDPLIARFAKRLVGIRDGVIERDHRFLKEYVWSKNEGENEKRNER